jgi:predicted Zn-dependent protease
MTRARTGAFLLLCLSLAVSVWAQSKGNGRINGKILDDQGKPAANVQVRAVKNGESTVMEAKTNDKGEWSMQGLTAGDWNFEFGKDGFDPQRMQVKIAENKNPPIDMKLTKASAVDPNVEIQEQMKKAVELQQAGKLADARKIIEDLAVKYPSVTRLHAFIATTYEGEKNYDQAVEHLKMVLDKEPNDAELKQYMAELLTLKGDKVEAQKILDTLDMTQVKDPTMFINMAISSINAGKADEALATLDKVAKQFPTRADIYYYHARANIVAKKMPDAKADLEKFISMAPPDSPQVADAKKLLEQLKDAK